MDFGRLPSLVGVDFRLPPDATASARVLARAPLSDQRFVQGSAQSAIRIGAPTFAHKEWVGSYYPSSAKDADYLRYYARQWSALELNSTHYGLPGPATTARWQALTPTGFKFCPKLPQRISHEMALSAASDADVRAFGAWLSTLGWDRLGMPFLQLPPTFGPEALPTLERFLLYYKEQVGGPLAVELRHPLWFASPLASEEAFNLLEALGVTAVISDVAGRRDVLHQRLTTPVAFLRLNGHALAASDYTRADAWAERLLDWQRAGLHAAYIFIHQKNPLHTAVLARYLADQLAARSGLTFPAPAPLAGPVQGSLF